MDKRKLRVLFFFVLLAVSSVPFSVSPVLADTETLGNTTLGGSVGSDYEIENAIRGNVFECETTGEISSITAYFTVTGYYSGDVKVAVYHENYTLLGSSSAKTVSTSGYQTFSMSDERIYEDYSYILVAWAESTGGIIYLVSGSGSSTEGKLDSQTFNGFPDPLVPTNVTFGYAIYCTYSELATYTFHGLYDENSGLLVDADERAVNVTSYWNDGTAAETFLVNGTTTKYFTTSPQYFIFDLGDVDREYWISEDEGLAGSIDIYIFTDSLTQYYISFLDLTGSLGDYPWVTASRYINGTLTIMDKRKIDVEKKFAMGLQNGKTYTIQVEAEAGTAYTFGDLLMTSTTSVELTIKGLEFPNEIILKYKYLRVYANRNNDTVSVIYQNTRSTTTNATVYIKYINGTVAASASYQTDSFNYTWSNANSTLNYYYEVDLELSDWGTMDTMKGFLPAAQPSTTADWGLDILGSLGDVDTAYLIPSFLVLCVAGCFSALSVPIGCFAVTGAASILYALSWLPVPPELLIACWFLSGIVALLWARRNVSAV